MEMEFYYEISKYLHQMISVRVGVDAKNLITFSNQTSNTSKHLQLDIENDIQIRTRTWK